MKCEAAYHLLAGPGNSPEGGQGGGHAGPQAVPVRGGPHQGGRAAEKPQQEGAWGPYW